MNKKYVLLLLFILMLMFSFTTVYATEQNIQVQVNNKYINFDVESQNIEGRVFVPLRAIFENLGAKVEWNDQTKTAIGSKENMVVEIQIDNKIATINNTKVELDVTAKMIGGRTLVPARFIAESLGAIVNWDEVNRIVYIEDDTKTSKEEGYYYFLYNSTKVTENDLDAIRTYINKFENTKNILTDTSKYKSAPEIYQALKIESNKLNGKLLGIQIFGIDDDVPSFKYIDKVDIVDPKGIYSSIHETKEIQLSDHFYSTFQNDYKLFTEDLSIYKIFDEDLSTDLIPEWIVSRLPLTKGEFENFIYKYEEYNNQAKQTNSVSLVAFSSPTFKSPYNKHQDDDISYFVERLSKDFNIIPEDSYRMYGNTRGIYRVNSDIVGELTLENMTLENEKQITNFLFKGHGNGEGTYQTITELDAITNKTNYLEIPFLTMDNINKVLDKNYYTFYMLSCSSAHGFNTENIVHEALANGKAINFIASPNELANNGSYNINWNDGNPHDVTLEDLKENNPLYFHYLFYENIYNGTNRSVGFYNAKKEYIEEILRHTHLTFGENYQFSLSNALSLHYLGLIEY